MLCSISNNRMNKRGEDLLFILTLNVGSANLLEDEAIRKKKDAIIIHVRQS